MTDPYTPTTEEVCKLYAFTRAGDRIHRTEEYFEAFDRWLAFHDAQVREEGAKAMRETAAIAAEGQKHEVAGWHVTNNSVAAAIRALPVPSTGTESVGVTVTDFLELGFSKMAVAVPEPTGDPQPEVCPECGKHRLTGDSMAMSHDDWVGFQAWIAAGKPTRPTPTESEENRA